MTTHVLRTRLKEMGKTQAWLAEKVGIRQSSVCEWFERGVPPKKVRKVAKLTGLSPKQLRPDIFGAA